MHLLFWALLFCAIPVLGQTLPEENRRVIERIDERMSNVIRTHEREMEEVTRRLDALEKYGIWMLITSGGVGGAIGLGGAGYYVRRNGRKPGA